MRNPCSCGQRGNFTSIPLTESETKVTFKCGNCGQTWNSGKRGGKFTQYLKDRGLAVHYPKKLQELR